MSSTRAVLTVLTNQPDDSKMDISSEVTLTANTTVDTTIPLRIDARMLHCDKELFTNADKKTTVYLGKWQEQEVAIKRYCKTTHSSIPDEITIISQIKPFLSNYMLDYKGCSETRRAYYLVMEYAPKGDVFGWILKHNVKYGETAWGRGFKILISAAEVVEKLHENNFIHRDLKWENFLLNDDYTVKMIDCEFFLELKENQNEIKTENFVGTPSYCALEILTEHRYSKASDCFAFGGMMYTMSEQSIPYGFPDWGKKQITNALNRNIFNSFTLNTPPPLISLIKRCWARDPKERPTMTIIKDELISLSKMIKPGKVS